MLVQLIQPLLEIFPWATLLLKELFEICCCRTYRQCAVLLSVPYHFPVKTHLGLIVVHPFLGEYFCPQAWPVSYCLSNLVSFWCCSLKYFKNKMIFHKKSQIKNSEVLFIRAFVFSNTTGFAHILYIPASQTFWSKNSKCLGSLLTVFWNTEQVESNI